MHNDALPSLRSTIRIDWTELLTISEAVLTGKDKVARGFKADSDARTVWRIDVDLSKPNEPVIRPQLIVLNEAIVSDPQAAARAEFWLNEAGAAICVKEGKPSGCLKDRIGWTQTPIELDEAANRSQETGFGNWLADEMLKKFDIDKPDVAIVGSGSLGLNDNLKPGYVTLRDLKEIFRYDGPVLVREFSANEVCAGLSSGFSRPGSGAWPHAGGVKIKIDKKKDEELSDVAIEFSKTGLSCNSTEKIRVAAVPYLLCGGDDYPFNLREPTEDVEKCRERLSNNLPRTIYLGEIAKKAIEVAGPAGIEPKKDGSPNSVNQPG